MSLRKAKAQVINEIRNIRYDNGSGYIWINDTRRPYPKMIMHPTVPKLNGQILNAKKYNCAGEKKQNLFQAFVDVTQASSDGTGFVDYLWPKPTKDGLTEDRPKLSYVKLIKNWGWIIGTGIYVDDAMEDAKQESIEVIKKMRYNDDISHKTKNLNGYFWINDTQLPYPKMIMHSDKAQLDGKILNLEKYNCAKYNGKDKENLFAAFVKVTADNTKENFIEYEWTKPNQGNKRYPKQSYVKRFEKWNWIIGTGVYTDDIDNLVTEKSKLINKQVVKLILLILGISLLIIFASLIIVYIYTNSYSKTLNHAVKIADRIASDDMSIEISESYLKRKDEIGDLARSYKNMLDLLKSLVVQANIIAEDDLNNNLLNTEASGDLGKSFSTVVIKLRNLAKQAELIANDDLSDRFLNQKIDSGVLGEAFYKMAQNLRTLANQAKIIAKGDLTNDYLNQSLEGDLGTAFSMMLNTLKNIVQQATTMSNGDLNNPVLEEELPGDIRSAFKTMVHNLRNIINNVKEGISQISSATKELEASAEEQTHTATEQASGITEVSATIEELSITARQIAKNTSELVLSSEDIIKVLNEDQENLNDGVIKLSDIGNLSKENATQISELGKRSAIINDMVRIITEVANKTNLLSLNASIEAARAGEVGKGFMVVSAEIRELSKETIASSKKVNEAAGQIQDFIESVVSASEREVEGVQKSVGVMQNLLNNIDLIIKNIKNNYGFTQKIDVSTKQQENGSKQAAETMKQMSEVSRQSSEVSRQSVTAIKDLVVLAGKLEEATKIFKL